MVTDSNFNLHFSHDKLYSVYMLRSKFFPYDFTKVISSTYQLLKTGFSTLWSYKNMNITGYKHSVDNYM